MKFTRKIFTTGLILSCIMISTSCDELLDVNDDPNNPSTSTAALTLPVAQVSLGTVMETDYNILGSMLAHYWTTGPTAAQYDFIDKYNIRTTDFDNAWIFVYSTILSDLQFVKEYGLEHDQSNYSAIAQLLQCYTFQMMVDLYDKIPYQESLFGDENMQPAFEDGDKIYDDLIVKIDAALDMIDSSPDAWIPGNEDLIYRGNMAMWRKFANTLKLKIYIRQAFARPEVSQAGIQALVDENAVFLGVGEDAKISFNTSVQHENPFWQELNQTSFENLVASNTTLDKLKASGDPRIETLYDASDAEDQFVGLDQGVGTQDGGLFEDYAHPSQTRIVTKAAPSYLVSAYESLFLQAEAAQRGWSDGDAKTLYDAAVSESFRLWGKSADVFLGVGDEYEYDGQLETIFYQKWLAFNGEQGLEGWLEWRRTGEPELPKSVQGRPLPNDFPLRLIWPITERSANPNVPPIATVDTPVWWDQI